MACEAEKTLAGGYDLYGGMFNGKLHGKLDHFTGWSRFNVDGLTDTSRIGRFSQDESRELGSHFSSNFLGKKTDQQQPAQDSVMKKAPGRHAAASRQHDTPRRSSLAAAAASAVVPRVSATATSHQPETTESSSRNHAVLQVEISQPQASRLESVPESPERMSIRHARSAPNFIPPAAQAAGKPIVPGEPDSQSATTGPEARAEIPRSIKHARSTPSLIPPHSGVLVGGKPIARDATSLPAVPLLPHHVSGSRSSPPLTADESLLHGNRRRGIPEVQGSLVRSTPGSAPTGSNNAISKDAWNRRDAGSASNNLPRSESGRSSSSSDSAQPNPCKDSSAAGSPRSSADQVESPTAATEKGGIKPNNAAHGAGGGNLRTVDSWPTATRSPAAAVGTTSAPAPRYRSWSGNLGNLSGGIATPNTGKLSNGFASNGKVMYGGGGVASASKETVTTKAAETPRALSSGMLAGLGSGVLPGGNRETVRSGATAAAETASRGASTESFVASSRGTASRGASAAATETSSNSSSSRGNIFAVGESLLIKRALSSSEPEEVKKVGNEQYKKGNFTEALSLYDRAIHLAPGQAPYHSNRAAALTGLGRLPEAVRECENAIKLNSSYPRAHQRLASLYLRLGRLEGAKKHLQIPGQNIIDVGEMLRVEKVAKHLENCYNARNASDWNAVVRECDAAVAVGADSAPQVLALKAEAFLKLHRYEEADIVLSTAQKIEGALRKSTSMQADIRTLLVQAQVDMALGRFEGAVIAAEKAAYFDPQNAEALPTLKRARAVASARTIGNDLYKAGKFLEASAAYNEGLQSDLTNAILLCNRAACRSKLGHYEKAVQDCNAALDAQPHYTKALLRRAHLYSKMERWDLSLKDFEALRKEMPGNVDVAQALFEVQIAIKISKGGLGTEEKLGVEVNICSNDQLREAISNHGIAVVQFNTRWSEGCRQMAPVVERLCKQNPTMNFLKVDTEENPYLAKAENVDVVPTFKIYKNGVKVMELPGPTEQSLENALSQVQY